MRGVALAVAPAGGAQLQPQAKGRFLHVDAALAHVDIERVFRRAAHQFHGLCALLREAVGIGLGAAGHRHVLHLLPVLPHTHRGWGNACVIHGILEGQLLILPDLQSRGQVVGCREDTTVLERMLRANQRCAAAGFEDVHVYALAPERQRLAGFHLCHQLHRVTAYGQTAHGHREAAIGRAAAGHRRAAALNTVHIQEDGLRASALHGVGDDHAVALRVAADAQTVAQAVAAAETEVHHAHTHIGLLGLRIAGCRVGGGGLHVDVGRAHLQELGHVKRVGSGAHLGLLFPVGLDASAHHANLDGGLLAGALTCIVAAHILVVVAPGQHTGTALLHDGLAHNRAQHDLGCGRVTTAATATACRNINARNLRAALILQ